jgi:hypothetical protein
VDSRPEDGKEDTEAEEEEVDGGGADEGQGDSNKGDAPSTGDSMATDSAQHTGVPISLKRKVQGVCVCV